MLCRVSPRLVWVEGGEAGYTLNAVTVRFFSSRPPSTNASTSNGIASDAPCLGPLLDLVLRAVAVQRLPSLQVPQGRPHLVDVGDLRVVENKPHLAQYGVVKAAGAQQRESQHETRKGHDNLGENIGDVGEMMM